MASLTPKRQTSIFWPFFELFFEDPALSQLTDILRHKHLPKPNSQNYTKPSAQRSVYLHPHKITTDGGTLTKS